MDISSGPNTVCKSDRHANVFQEDLRTLIKLTRGRSAGMVGPSWEYLVLKKPDSVMIKPFFKTLQNSIFQSSKQEVVSLNEELHVVFVPQMRLDVVID